MKQPWKSIFIVLIASFICAPLFAQEQPPMTERELSKFISDWPSVAQWMETHGKRLESASNGNSMRALFTGTEFSAFLKGKGWTIERFSYVTGATVSLLTYISYERENPDIIKEFDDAIVQIRADPDMSSAQKAEMIKNLEDTKKSMMSLNDGANLNEAELKMVRARYTELVKLFNIH